MHGIFFSPLEINDQLRNTVMSKFSHTHAIEKREREREERRESNERIKERERKRKKSTAPH